MKLTATLGNPVLIGFWSVSLLLLGCSIGLHWHARPMTALILAVIGSALMIVHDLAIGILWFWAAASMFSKMQQRQS